MPQPAIEIHGALEVRRGLFRVARFFPQRVANTLKQEADAIMETAKNSHVPVDKGKLRDSGRVSDPVITFQSISVDMAFGGPDIPYAEAVHEHLSAHSPPSWVAAEAAGRPVHFSPEGRGPKYLEKPMKEAMAGMDGRITVSLRRELAIIQP